MNMRGFVLRSAALAAALLITGACRDNFTDEADIAPDYSADYTTVTVLDEYGRTRRVLVPEACLRPDKQSPADQGPERLPPGCANNANLQHMVESKRDLKRGRKLSPALAGPVAGASQRYTDKQNPTLGGGVRTGTGSFVNGTTTTETPAND